MILIVSAFQDLHALAVHERVRKLGKECHLIQIDTLAQANTISYKLGAKTADCARVKTSENLDVSVSDARVIWLRRIRANQILKLPLTQEEGYEVLNNDCRGALSALLLTKFKGVWLSNPEATFRASDKIFQLKLAEESGFRIPRTLVSQSKDDVRAFYHECAGNVIIKTVVGVHEPFLRTVRLQDPDTFENDDFEVCPAIYQECIEGTKHLRLLSLDHRSFGAIIETDELDWRGNLSSKMTAYEAPPDLHARIRKALYSLGLEMGVVDIKLDCDEQPVWLEVNPQGQFLFMQPLVNVDFIGEFASYLSNQASR